LSVYYVLTLKNCKLDDVYLHPLRHFNMRAPLWIV